jgi:hypothetical protein
VNGTGGRACPMTPGNVLDMHARLREAFRAPSLFTIRFMDEHIRASLLHAEKMRPGTARSLFAAGRDGRALCGELARDLFTAATFQVTAEMTDVVQATYSSERGTIAGLHTEELPAETGFAWLDAPLLLTPRGAAESDDDPGISISAVTWAVCTYALPGGTVVSGGQVTGWCDPRNPGPWTEPGKAEPRRAGARPPLIPLLTDVTPLGHAPAGSPCDDGSPGFAHWVHVLWIYMSAEITAMHRDPVARAYRRRAAGTLRQAEVNVVTLRRARAEGDASGEPRDIDWSCCWPVQGHHRHTRLVPGAAPHHATPAASDRGHCALCGGAVSWVHGYVKGPDDKPLRVHDKTLYRLSR